MPVDSLQIGQIIDQFHQVAPGRGYIAGVIGIIATERTLQLTTDGISVCNDSAERLAQRPVQTLAEHMGIGALLFAAPLGIAGCPRGYRGRLASRSEEHTSELQSLMRTSYAVFCLKNKKRY